MRLAALGVIAPVFLSACAAGAGNESKLPIQVVRIDTDGGSKQFVVEIAGDAISQERGLMYRRDLAPDSGMLFDFHQEAQVSFWMKNTPLPLDMVFIRGDGTVASVEPNAIPFSTAMIPSGEPVRAVLEINGGRAHDLGIKPGDRVRADIFHDAD